MMKTDFARLLVPLALASLTASAAPLGHSTPVHVKPDANAPVITVLPANSEAPAPATDASAPAGWSAVQLAGPHEVYVDNRDITKSLDVKPGSAYRVRPSSDAAVLATAAEGDPVEITGLRGRWTQLRLARPVTGFAQMSGGAPAGTPATAAAPSPTAPDTSASAPSAGPRQDAPSTAASAPSGGQGRAVPMTDRGDGGIAALPRLFEGQFVSTRAPFRPRRPYDYAIQDNSGARIAYVDLSKLLLTDQIENYVNRTVAVYGTARPVPDTKDIVITVESLQLR